MPVTTRPATIREALHRSNAYDDYVTAFESRSGLGWHDPTPASAAGGSLSVVIPARNMSYSLPTVLDALAAQQIEQAPEVIVVDDGSGDGTAEAARRHPLHPVTVRMPRRRGPSTARNVGAFLASGDTVVFADADMATPPDMLVALVAALDDADVALGSRIQPDGSDMRKSQPRYRRLLGKAFHLLASLWVIGPVQDTQCGFKGFRRAAAHDLFARQRITSIVFDVELIYLARRRGYSMAIVPITWADRRGSRMRARPGLAARVAWDLLRIPLIHRRLGRLTTPAEGTEDRG